jgi:hopanoid-associated phosphorylase
MKLGIVTGMVAEARLLNDIECMAVSGGGHADATNARIAELIDAGVTHLASFGIAGALDPALNPGDLLLASDIVLPDGARVAPDKAWLARASQTVPRARLLPIAGASRAVATAAAKAELFRTSQAAAIDMESHHVALAAQRHRLPFIAVRAIADTAADELPPAAVVGLDKEGRPAIGAVLLSLLLNPFQLPALLRVARRTDIALKALLGGRAGLL